MVLLYNILVDGGDSMNKTKMFAVLMIVALASGIALAVASITLTSNPVTTNPTTVTLALTQDNSTPRVNVDTVHYTAACSDTSFTGLVTFKDANNNVLGSANAVAGIATIGYMPTSANQIVVTATAPYP